MAKNTKSQAVLKTLSGRKRGLTALEVADKSGVKIGTVRAYIQAFKAQGLVEVQGKVETGKVGRPQFKYVAV